MDLSLAEVEEALKYTDWYALLKSRGEVIFPVLLRGEVTLAKLVLNEDKEDEDWDRKLKVVVEIEGRYFGQTGWKEIGSHCYGDYEPQWNGIEEFFPKVVKALSWD